MSSSLSSHFWDDVVDIFWQETLPIVHWLMDELIADGKVVGDVPLDSDVARVQTMLGLEQSGAAEMLPVVNPKLAQQLSSDAQRASERLMGLR